MNKETPLFKAFDWRNREAIDIADSMGNRSVCKHTLALVQAAAGKFKGYAGTFEIAHRIAASRPVAATRGLFLRHPEPK